MHARTHARTHTRMRARRHAGTPARRHAGTHARACSQRASSRACGWAPIPSASSALRQCAPPTAGVAAAGGTWRVSGRSASSTARASR
eukprot:4362872-Alexandrium_andersonii.AAC.1